MLDLGTASERLRRVAVLPDGRTAFLGERPSFGWLRGTVNRDDFVADERIPHPVVPIANTVHPRSLNGRNHPRHVSRQRQAGSSGNACERPTDRASRSVVVVYPTRLETREESGSEPDESHRGSSPVSIHRLSATASSTTPLPCAASRRPAAAWIASRLFRVLVLPVPRTLGVCRAVAHAARIREAEAKVNEHLTWCYYGVQHNRRAGSFEACSYVV